MNLFTEFSQSLSEIPGLPTQEAADAQLSALIDKLNKADFPVKAEYKSTTREERIARKRSYAFLTSGVVHMQAEARKKSPRNSISLQGLVTGFFLLPEIQLKSDEFI